MNRPTLHLLLAAALALPCAVFGQELPLTHYTSTREVNPLPSTSVMAIHQDRQGFIWMAAWNNALVRYDGQHMESFTAEDGLRGLDVWSIQEDREGYLWALAQAGASVSEKPLADFKPGERIRFAAPVPSDTATARPLRSTPGNSAVDRLGRIWVAGLDGSLYRYTSGNGPPIRLEVVRIERPGGGRAEVSSLGARRNGQIWAVTEDDLFLIFDEGKQVYTELLEGRPLADIEILYEGPSGTFWAGGTDGSVWRLVENGHKRGFEKVFQLAGGIKTLRQETSGVLWAGGLNTGLARYHPASGLVEKTYDRTNGLLDEYIWNLTLDREGNLWLAHMTGASRLPADFAAFTRYTARSFTGEQPVLPGAETQAVLPDVPVGRNEHALVAGTNEGLAVILPDGRSAPIGTSQGLNHNAVLAACLYDQNQLWVGTYWGFSRISFGTPPAPLPSPFTRQTTTALERTLTVESLGAPGFANFACGSGYLPDTGEPNKRLPIVCFGGFGNVNCNLGGEWFTFEKAAGIPSDDTILHVSLDQAGHLLVGTSKYGLIRSKTPVSPAALHAAPGHVGTLSLRIETPVFEPVPEVDAVQVDRSARVGNEMWLTSNNGIYILDGRTGKVTGRLSAGRELPADRSVTGITLAPSGTVWVGISKVGLAEIDPKQRRLLRVVGKKDGLLDDQPWGAQAVAAGTDGAIYLGTPAGVSRYRPALDRRNTMPTPLVFRRFQFTETGGGRNELEVRFAGLSFGNEKNIRYRTRLVGYDPDWSPEKDVTEIRYTNLGAFLVPRTYVFEVTAANNDGVWTARPLTQSVEVRPVWWLTWWAFGLYAVLIGAGVFGIDRIQRRRVIRQERQQSLIRENQLRTEAAEAWASYLQADNERKTQELESARALQLSMLPKDIPNHPWGELAAYMKTATEVGGDYYDFHPGSDGALTIAIGDATGHGSQAGTMVTAMKSLFTVHADEPDLAAILRRSAVALRRMRLPKLYMAIALGRLRENTLELVGAGMPPALLYRAGSGTVEPVSLKGMPLGSPGTYPYRVERIHLAPGDTVLLMSDGFPELKSASGELFGYDEVVSVFQTKADRSPEEIIEHIKTVAGSWTDNAPPDDDMTFVVLRARLPVHTGYIQPDESMARETGVAG